MKDVFEEAGIEVGPDNKKGVDRRIHEIVGVTYKDCPAAWRAVKEEINDEASREAFVKRLKAAK
jgi:hypothetical protein